jgi:hypothetical protein
MDRKRGKGGLERWREAGTVNESVQQIVPGHGTAEDGR